MGWAGQALCVFDAFCGQVSARDEAIAGSKRVHLGQLSAAQKFDINGHILAVFDTFWSFGLGELVKN